MEEFAEVEGIAKRDESVLVSVLLDTMKLLCEAVTLIVCICFLLLGDSAHEYTLSNAKFALSVEPSNLQLVSKVKEVESKRQDNLPTVPSTIGEELETNPFLRIDVSEELRKNVGVEPGSMVEDAEVFGKVRNAKDTFRG